MKYLTSILLLFVGVSFIGCAVSTVAVNTDYDREAEFGEYMTYYWSDAFKNENTDQEGDPLFYNSLIKKRLKRAISDEMDGRGYKMTAENPDLLINPQVTIEQKTTTSNVNPYPYYGFYYGGYNNVQTQNYKEGGIVIDFIDREKKQLVWQGYVSSVLEAQTEDKQREIRDAVSMIFAEYPYRAGESERTVASNRE